MLAEPSEKELLVVLYQGSTRLGEPDRLHANDLKKQQIISMSLPLPTLMDLPVAHLCRTASYSDSVRCPSPNGKTEGGTIAWTASACGWIRTRLRLVF